MSTVWVGGVTYLTSRPPEKTDRREIGLRRDRQGDDDPGGRCAWLCGSDPEHIHFNRRAVRGKGLGAGVGLMTLPVFTHL